MSYTRLQLKPAIRIKTCASKGYVPDALQASTVQTKFLLLDTPRTLTFEACLPIVEVVVVVLGTNRRSIIRPIHCSSTHLGLQGLRLVTCGL